MMYTTAYNATQNILYNAIWEAILALLSTIVTVTGGCMMIDWLTSFYMAYRRVAIRLEDESWLRENCRDPIFFDKMRAHTTLCTDVETNARVGAFWIALQDATNSIGLSSLRLSSPWQLGGGHTGLALAVVLLVIFSMAACCWGPAGRARMHSYDGLPVCVVPKFAA